jgi:type II secretory pathway pseudopilin PulG
MVDLDWESARLLVALACAVAVFAVLGWVRAAERAEDLERDAAANLRAARRAGYASGLWDGYIAARRGARPPVTGDGAGAPRC